MLISDVNVVSDAHSSLSVVLLLEAGEGIKNLNLHGFVCCLRQGSLSGLSLARVFAQINIALILESDLREVVGDVEHILFCSGIVKGARPGLDGLT